MPKRESTGAALIAALFWTLTIAGANAGEGVIEINQALALEGGVTPGDAPGFPVTIDAPGSYVLTGNLNVATDSRAITILSDDVTLDLRGFHVRGSGGGADVNGISFEDTAGNYPPADRVEVRNGIVENFSGHGVRLGNEGRVLDLRLTNNQVGAAVEWHGMMRGNTVVGSTLGLDAGRGSRVADNVINESDGGIECGIRFNLTLDGKCVIRDNVLAVNNFGISTGGSVIKDNVIANAEDWCIIGADNLIIDNKIQNCGIGIRGFFKGSGTNSLRGNVLRSNTTDLQHLEPVFFLGPNQCGSTTCQ